MTPPLGHSSLWFRYWQHWLSQQGGFHSSAGFIWTYRVEHPSLPMMLEVRQKGQILFTLEISKEFPFVVSPVQYALTVDGPILRLFRFTQGPEFIWDSESEDEQRLTLFHSSKFDNWKELSVQKVNFNIAHPLKKSAA